MNDQSNPTNLFDPNIPSNQLDLQAAQNAEVSWFDGIPPKIYQAQPK